MQDKRVVCSSRRPWCGNAFVWDRGTSPSENIQREDNKVPRLEQQATYLSVEKWNKLFDEEKERIEW